MSSALAFKEMEKVRMLSGIVYMYMKWNESALTQVRSKTD